MYLGAYALSLSDWFRLAWRTRLGFSIFYQTFQVLACSWVEATYSIV